MAIEIADLPNKDGGSFHSNVSLPEGSLSGCRLVIHYLSPFTRRTAT